jgi:uncharacterized Zn finger protein
MSYGYGFGWRPYVRVADRRREAVAAMKKLATKGFVAQPVVIEGRAIARTFWGKAWCENLERYSDFANRIPRGRTYVRNGSVVHLEISKGLIEARVMGSELYAVAIRVAALKPKAWAGLKSRCAGQVASLLDLLGGKLSDGVMALVTDRDGGLFPSPRQISFECSCPDWAGMCKHVAAVLYGVGARLDERPELLFLLRGVNHEELVSVRIDQAVASMTRGGSRRRLAESELGEVFGPDLDTAPARTRSDSSEARRSPRPAGAARPRAFPERMKGPDVRRLRKRLGLDVERFASRLGVSPPSVRRWEAETGEIVLRSRTRAALKDAWESTR